jgi:MoxR-like ATPase
VLIITSNSEKSLPDAFLRRCVYYNIAHPTRERFLEIVQSHLEDLRGASPYLAEALDLFMQLREEKTGLRKIPATAELLGWLLYLSDRIANNNQPLRRNGEVLRASVGALVKSADDQEIAKTVIEEWLSRSRK